MVTHDIWCVTLPIVYTEQVAPSEDWSEPFCVLKTGEWKYRDRNLKITEADLDRAVDVFNQWQAKGIELPIDYDHTFATKGDSRAAGWYRSLSRVGDKLMARVEWTDTARDLIKAKEYKYFSSEFNHNHTDTEGVKWGFSMISGGLTNRPFLKGLGAVALAEKPDGTALSWLLHDRHSDMSDPTPSKGSEPRPDTVTLSASELTTLREQSKELAALRADRSKSEDTVTALSEQVSDLTKKVTVLSDQATTLADRVKSESERADAYEAELTSNKFNVAFTEAQRQGKLDAKPATRDKWTKRLKDHGLDFTLELLSELVPVIPVRENGHGNPAPFNPGGDAPSGRVLFKDELDLPVDPDKYALSLKIEEYTRSHPGTSYSDAYDAVLATERV